MGINTLDRLTCYSRRDLEAFNLLEAPVFIFDHERKGMWWGNPAAQDLWNAKSLEDLISRNFKDDMSDTIRQRIDDQLVKLKNGEIIYDQWTLYPNGRGPVTLSSSVKVICIQDEEKHDGGCAQRYAGLVECEKPNAKENVNSEVVRAVEVLRHLPIPVCQFDIEGKLQYQNPESSKRFGGEEVHANFMSLFIDETVGEHIFNEVAREGKDHIQEAELKTTQGTRWFSISVRRRKDPIDSKLVILYSAQDMTELVRTREEKQQAKSKSEFMAVMAHEIRTPLHQVIGSLDLICLTNLDEKQTELMTITRGSTSLLMTIINDLLDYTKLEDGKVQLENISFEPRGVINSCLEAVRPRANEKGLSLSCDIADSVPLKLVGDPNRLRQILLNLLQNAVKFTDRGSVKVSAKPAGSTRNRTTAQHLRFEVRDTGIGIAESQQELIFEKYRQANVAITRKYGGTGLGLAICRALVELMGGHIDLESSLGLGTTFSFDVRLEAHEESRSASIDTLNAVNETLPSCSLHVLVAEDNLVNQKVLTKMLERLGHTVTVVENGKKASETLGTDQIDLVLMDVQMPVMDGIEATKLIRSQGNCTSQVPIVGLTASYQHSDLQYYQDIGMNHCIGKPVRLKQLQEAIGMFQRSNPAA